MRSLNLSQWVGGWMLGGFSTRRFLAHLEPHLTTVIPGREKQCVRSIRGRAKQIVREDEADLVVDRGSKGMLRMSAAVLAAYESLAPELGHERTILFLQHVFTESIVHTSGPASGLLLRRGGESLDTVERFMRPLTRIYGKAMEFEFERNGDEWFEMRVTKCFFAQFFSRRGLRDVTTVMCAADAFWMDQIDPALMGVRAERTSLLSLGDPVDRFRIVASDDPLSEGSDVLRTRGPGRTPDP